MRPGTGDGIPGIVSASGPFFPFHIVPGNNDSTFYGREEGIYVVTQGEDSAKNTVGQRNYKRRTIQAVLRDMLYKKNHYCPTKT